MKKIVTILPCASSTLAPTPNLLILRKIKYLLLGFLFFSASCQKRIGESNTSNDRLSTEYHETIKKMVAITKAETNRINSLSKHAKRVASRNSMGWDTFVENQLQNYCEQLLAVEPLQLEPDGFQINIPNVDWTNEPGVIEADAISILPSSMTQVLDRIENEIMAIVDNPIYEQQDNLSNAIYDI